MATGTVHVSGLKELTRALKGISNGLDRELVGELKAAADPVKAEGEKLALTEIRNMPRSPDWAAMRIGVSKAQGSVYMVPQRRRRGGSGRSNLATLLMQRAMDPAVERNQDEVVKRVDDLIGRLADNNGF